MSEEVKGIRKISTFVTADALLAATHMVWAQLWIQPSVRLWAVSYNSQSKDISKMLQTLDINVGAGLIWTYSALLFALLALIWVGCSTLRTTSDKVSFPAIGLFGASVTMSFINVSISLYAISRKLLSGDSIWEPLSPPVSFGWLFFSEIVVILVIVVVSMLVAYEMNKSTLKKAES